jgi:predicted nicotinamide N-methyase
VKSKGVIVRIDQDVTGVLGAGCGATIWDSAMVLSAYIDRANVIHQNSRVLDIGAGTGLVGLVAASLGASNVYLGDRPRILPLINQNISLNSSLIQHVESFAVTFGENNNNPFVVKGNYDVIVVSDMLYLPELYTDIVLALCECSSMQTVILIAYEERQTLSEGTSVIDR